LQTERGVPGGNPMEKNKLYVNLWSVMSVDFRSVWKSFQAQIDLSCHTNLLSNVRCKF